MGVKKQPQLDDLIIFFDSLNELPNSITLSKHEVVVNVEKCIYAHISFLKNNSGNKSFKPYFDRLARIKDILEVQLFDP